MSGESSKSEDIRVFSFSLELALNTPLFSSKKVEGTLMFAIGKEDQGACISKPDMVYTLISFATE